MEDYEKYEGKVVKAVRDDDETVFDALIVGLDFDIGFTIVDNNDKDNYLACLLGDTVFKDDNFSKEDYKIFFDEIVKQIKSGVINLDEMDELFNSLTGVSKEVADISKILNTVGIGGPSAEFCAFNR